MNLGQLYLRTNSEIDIQIRQKENAIRIDSIVDNFKLRIRISSR